MEKMALLYLKSFSSMMMMNTYLLFSTMQGLLILVISDTSQIQFYDVIYLISLCGIFLLDTANVMKS